jgi:hypothetical protein
MPPLRALRLSVAALLATLVLTTPAYAASKEPPALAPAAPDALTRALAAGELTEAQYALERARSLFHLAAVRARHGMVRPAGARDATLVLRDLAARLHELSPAEREVARRLLARPTDSPDPGGDSYATAEETPYCTANACIHYVATTRDAPDPADADADLVPDYVESVGTEFENVWATEVVGYGFRPPKSDLTSPNHGPDGRIDIYLADIGANGFYGYCTTDDPAATPSATTYDVSAYCVLDDDFSPGQFAGAASGLAALQVTLAHEFAHAVQFAYDFFEDVWLLEGTAVWFEDEVYDDVNDNYQYLTVSPLARPDIPLDLGITNPSSPLAGTYYGTFPFFKYLAEVVLGGDPSIVRTIWERADGAASGPDDFSIQAIHNALRNLAGSTFADAFGGFAAANAYPEAFYEEGSAYPTPPIARRATLTAARRTAFGSSTLDHLTNAYHLLRPGAGLAPNARLRVAVDLPSRTQGPKATLIVVQASGALRVVPVTLNARGDGSATVAFGRGKVTAVVVVLSNASTRYRNCFVGLPFACGGEPRDDGRAYRYTARVL